MRRDPFGVRSKRYQPRDRQSDPYAHLARPLEMNIRGWQDAAAIAIVALCTSGKAGIQHLTRGGQNGAVRGVLRRAPCGQARRRAPSSSGARVSSWASPRFGGRATGVGQVVHRLPLFRFVAEFSVDGNASAAVRRAGYSPRSARVGGPRMLPISFARAGDVDAQPGPDSPDKFTPDFTPKPPS